MGDALRRQFDKAYQDPGQAVLEGFHPARHAVAFGATLGVAVTYDVDRLTHLAERLAPDLMATIGPVLRVVDRAAFEKLSPRSLSSPLLSIAPRPDYRIDRCFAGGRKPIIFLERPRNPGNVGAVIRVAAAADMAAVVVSGQVDPWSPVVLRSGTGLQFALDVGNGDLPPDTDRPIVVVDAAGDPLRPADLDPDAILVVGGERYGVSEEVRQRAQRSVAVPMRHGVSSLNLATALAAVVYSWKAASRERTGSEPW